MIHRWGGSAPRNRVTPSGEIVAIPLRGAWTGNRGNLHRGTEIVRQWASPHWLNAFRAVWADGAALPLHDEIDGTLHRERVVARTRRRRTSPARWDALPDGAFVLVDGTPALVVGRSVVRWTVKGYGERLRRPRGGDAELLTPPSSVAVLRAGYPVQIEPGAVAGGRV